MGKRRIAPERFRILICGRANAGKTTILRRLCGASEDYTPVVNSKKGGKSVLSPTEGGGKDVLSPTEGRGMHEIDDELTFESNPGYVFHDSRGIECAGVEEVAALKTFIERRAHDGDFKERLHVIWLCISADSDRPLLEGGVEMEILKTKAGRVPIVVIFTKCEALEIKALSTLRETRRHLTEDEVWQQAPEEARRVLQDEFYSRLTSAGHPIDLVVELQRMNEPDGICDQLVSATERALNDDNVAQLFLVTERVNIGETAVVATRRAIRRMASGQPLQALDVTTWFPHNSSEVGD